MTTTTHTSSQTASNQPPQRRVTDAPTRMFHALFGLMFIVAYITADSEHWRNLHMAAGYTFAALLGFRLLYSLVGPQSLRLGVLWRKLALAPQWLRSLKTPLKANWKQGQNIVMAGCLVSIMLAALPLAASGYVMFNELGPEWWLDGLEEAHELLGNWALLAVLGHVALLLLTSLLRAQNMARPMLTGTIEGTGPSLIKSNRVWLAVVLLVGVIGLFVYFW